MFVGIERTKGCWRLFLAGVLVGWRLMAGVHWAARCDSMVGMKIEVRKPRGDELEAMGVFTWPIWTCEVSTFDYVYDERESCYILEGQVTVESAGEKVSFGKGDLVVFPRGLSCVWKVAEPVRKHYRFG